MPGSTQRRESDAQALLTIVFGGGTAAGARSLLARDLPDVWLGSSGEVDDERLMRLLRGIGRLPWFSSLTHEHQRAMILDGYKLLSLQPPPGRRTEFAEHWAAIARDDDKRSRFEQLRREGRLAA